MMSRGGRNKVKLLLVDDDPHLLELGELFLKDEDQLIVETAISAEEAMGKLKNEEYDAIISDYEMPRMDGLEFFETIKERDIDLPFIIFTGSDRDGVEEEAKNLGVDRFLRKDGRLRKRFSDLADVVIEEVERKDFKGNGREKKAENRDGSGRKKQPEDLE